MGLSLKTKQMGRGILLAENRMGKKRELESCSSCPILLFGVKYTQMIAPLVVNKSLNNHHCR